MRHTPTATNENSQGFWCCIQQITLGANELLNWETAEDDHQAHEIANASILQEVKVDDENRPDDQEMQIKEETNRISLDEDLQPRIKSSLREVRSTNCLTEFDEQDSDLLTSSLNTFAEMNSMYKRVGVKFDNKRTFHLQRLTKEKIKQALSNITAIGDAHLLNLERACVREKQKLDKFLGSDSDGNSDLSHVSLPETLKDKLSNVLIGKSETSAIVGNTPETRVRSVSDNAREILEKCPNMNILELKLSFRQEGALNSTSMEHRETKDCDNGANSNCNSNNNSNSNMNGASASISGNALVNTENNNDIDNCSSIFDDLAKKTYLGRLMDLALTQSEIYLLQGKHDVSLAILRQGLKEVFDILQCDNDDSDAICTDKSSHGLVHSTVTGISKDRDIDDLNDKMSSILSQCVSESQLSQQLTAGLSAGWWVHDLDMVGKVVQLLSRLGATLRVKGDLHAAAESLHWATRLLQRGSYGSGSNITIETEQIKTEKANLYSSLAVVLDQMGKSKEALIAENIAMGIFSKQIL